MNKIIWTKKELVEWVRSGGDPVVPPLGLITASPRSETKAVEVSTVEGKIVAVMVLFPPGHYGLAWASVFLNDKMLLSPLAGDNAQHSFRVLDDIEQGDKISVIVKNTDTQQPHTTGVRVEVEEEKEGGKHDRRGVD